MTSAPAIGFEYRPSRWPAIATAAMLLLAVLAVALSGLPGWARLVVAGSAMAGVLVSLAWRPAPPASVGWSPESGWSLIGADGCEAGATLVSHRVMAGCLVLELRTPRRQVLWLMPDNSDADTRRRLRMRLAGQAGASVAPPS